MKELVEKILEKLTDIGGCDATCDFDKGWDDAIDEAISIVQKVAKEYKSGWIACSVRLPEPKTKSFGNKQKRTNVLVTLRNGVVKEMTYEFATKEFWEAGDENYIEHWKEDYNGNDIEVIAWMPLPELYQPKGE